MVLDNKDYYIMGSVPFMTWTLPSTSNDDMDSDSTFYEPEDKDMGISTHSDTHENSNNDNILYEGNIDATETEKENNNFCVNDNMNLKYLHTIKSRNITDENNTQLSSKEQESLKNLFQTNHESNLKNPTDNKIMVNNNCLEICNGMERLKHTDNLTSTTLGSSSADEGYGNSTVGSVFTETSNITETSSYNNKYTNQHTDEESDMNSTMTELISLFQNGTLKEEKCNTYHGNSASNFINPSIKQIKDTKSGLVCHDVQSSFDDGFAIEEHSMIMEHSDVNISNNPVEQNAKSYDTTLQNGNNMLKEISSGLHYTELNEFSIPPQENSFLSANTDDILSNFDLETLSAYEKNIYFMLENDRFQDILKNNDFQDRFSTFEGYKYSAPTNNYSTEKRKWPNPKQWPKIRKLKAIRCKIAERTLPQRSCQTKCLKSNRKICKSEDFIELSSRKRKGKQVEVSIQKQHLSTNNYITRNTSHQCQREQPQSVRKLGNKHYSVKSIEDIKYLEKVKVALNVLSFHIERWTSGQDEHPPARDEVVNMLHYVERVHTNLKDKAQKCGDRKGRAHFLRIIKDAEQLSLKIKNAIIEADRLYQMEQEQLLTSTEQSQFINKNTVASEIAERYKSKVFFNKIMNRKELVINENSGHVSDVYCKKDIPLQPLNDINVTTKKPILRNDIREREKYKKETKRISFSKVVSFIPEGVICLDSDDDFDESVQACEINQNKEINNKHSDMCKIKFLADNNVCKISEHVNTVQKQIINKNNTCTTEISMSKYPFQQIESITLKEQVNVNEKKNNQHSNIKYNDITCSGNQNHKQVNIKNQTSDNFLSYNYCQSNCIKAIRNINNNSATKNQNELTSLQNNKLENPSKEVQMQNREILETVPISDMNFKQFQHKNLYRQVKNKSQVNKDNSKCNQIKDNVFIKTTDNNGTDGNISIVNTNDENDYKCSNKVNISAVKSKRAKKKLNSMPKNYKLNAMSVCESGYSDRLQKTGFRNESIDVLSKMRSMKNKGEQESSQRVNSSQLGKQTYLKQMVSSAENTMTTGKPVQYNVEVTAFLDGAQTDSTESLTVKDCMQNNTIHNQIQINKDSMEMDKTQLNVIHESDLKLPVLTYINRDKLNKYKQLNTASTAVSNLNSKNNAAITNTCLANPNFSVKITDTIINRDIDKQKTLCERIPHTNDIPPLFSTQYTQVTKDNHHHRISSVNQTGLNSAAYNKNKFITTYDKPVIKQNLVHHSLINTKTDYYIEQNVNYQEDPLMGQNIPDQFKIMKTSSGSQEEDNISELQQITLTNEFTFDEVHNYNYHDDTDNRCDANKSSFDWQGITIMDVNRVRIKNKKEYILNSEIIFDSEELFKDLAGW